MRSTSVVAGLKSVDVVLLVASRTSRRYVHLEFSGRALDGQIHTGA